MDKQQAIDHNKVVIADAIAAMMESKMVDPILFIQNRQYAVNSIQNYLEAANLARECMHMPKIVLYNVRMGE